MISLPPIPYYLAKLVCYCQNVVVLFVAFFWHFITSVRDCKHCPTKVGVCCLQSLRRRDRRVPESNRKTAPQRTLTI